MKKYLPIWNKRTNLNNNPVNVINHNLMSEHALSHRIKKFSTVGLIPLFLSTMNIYAAPQALQNGNVQLVPYTLTETTSVYKLAAENNLSLDQLDQFNNYKVRDRQSLPAGETLMLPANSPIFSHFPSNTNKNINNVAKLNPNDANTADDTSSIDFSIMDSILSDNATETTSTTETATNAVSKLTLADLSPKPNAYNSDYIANATTLTPATHLASNSIVDTNNRNNANSTNSNDAIDTRNHTDNTGILGQNNTAEPHTIQEIKPAEIVPYVVTVGTPTSTENPSVTSEQTSSIAMQPATQAELMQDSVASDPTINTVNNASNNMTNSNAKNMFANQASAQVSNYVSNQIANFGNAQANIAFDTDGKIDNAAFRYLGNLYENGTGLLFTQLGVHQQDEGDKSRTVGNLGVGYRWDRGNSMLGGNTFIDHDFSYSNTRLGFGVEWAMDYLKIASNFYSPLSSWKQSHVINNITALAFNERPARGYDIRAQGYLPNHPQLGGSFVFEQYFGEHVALFDLKDKKKDPMALSIGVDYTPIPLVTAKAVHKIGENGDHDTIIDLALKLQLGTPLDAQLNPANVAQMRTLKGSRYDFVDRNDKIVYEYQQQNHHLAIAGPNSAMSNQSVAYSAQLDTSTNLVGYHWQIEGPASTQEYNTSNVNFSVNAQGVYRIHLSATTATGDVISASPRLLTVTPQENSALNFVQNKANTTPDVKFINYLSDEPLNQKLVLDFVTNAPSNQLSDPTLPYIVWRSSEISACQDWCKLDSSFPYLKAETELIDSQTWRWYLMADETLTNIPLQFKVIWLENGKVYQAETAGMGRFINSTQ